MLPTSPLLQLAPARAASVLNRVRRQIWTTIAPIAVEGTASQESHRGWDQARREPLRPVVEHSHWGRLWDQRWFRLRLPAPASDRPRYLAWDDQAESTLYIDGAPHYGLDVAHREAPLPAGAREVWIESVVVQTGVWHPAATGIDDEGSLHRGARLLERDDDNWKFYHDLSALLELLRLELRQNFGEDAAKFEVTGTKPAIGSVDPRLRRLLHGVDRVIDAWETDGPRAAGKAADRLFAELPPAPDAVKAVLTGHAHIDLVWLWPEHVGEFKAVHTFATANRLMDTYPEFRFGYSQPASYEAVGRRSPAMLKAARARMASGRWEATGATYVESDTIMACGEALARSFLIGQRRFKLLRGSPATVLWLPDVFGYSPCLPQIMNGLGVPSFYTTKLTWSAITRFPHSSFVWRGHDGSEVVAHVTHDHDYNQQATAAQLRLGERAHRQAHIHPEFLAPTGYGDGGGGPTEEMCERVRRIGAVSGMPRAEWGGIEPFFERLQTRRAGLPVFQGELYLEYHRGTYTTHGEIKALMREAERALQVHEAVRCATGGGEIEEHPWTRVVFAQFHDYIPGSSIHEVYADARRDLTALIREQGKQAIAELGGEGESSWFNPLPRPAVLRVRDSDGRPVVVKVPPLSGGPAGSFQEVRGLAPVRAGRRTLDNGRVHAVIDTKGRVSRLRVDGMDLSLRSPLGELVVYPDNPHNFEAWDIDRQTLALGSVVTSPAVFELEQEEPDAAVIACRRSLGEDGEVIVRYRLEAGSPVLRVDLELDWRRGRRLLKMLFPTNYAGRQARYGCPFGSVTRPQVPGDSADEAMWEVPGSRWAAVADETEAEGLLVVTRDKYGFSCRDGVLGLTLVRSAAMPRGGAENEDSRSHPQSIRRLMPDSAFSDIGRHSISLALGLHTASAVRDEHGAALADLLFTPPVSYRGPAVRSALVGLLGGESLQPAWAKPAENVTVSWILRLHETLGRRGVARVMLEPGWKAVPVDLAENALGEPLGNGELAFSPYALHSLLITRGD